MSFMEVPRAELDDARPHPLFARSLTPMLIADDERRFVEANPAACLFLRLTPAQIASFRIDDLTAAPRRAELDARWSEFLHRGEAGPEGRSLPWDLRLPDGTSVAIAFGATPYFQPGRHLAVIRFPAARALDERLDAAKSPTSDVLTRREREILVLVALGNTGVQIARQLFLSPATVATHVTNALVKLGAKNRAHGIAIGLRSGELDLHDGLHAQTQLIAG